MKRRVLAMILTGALAVSILAGCGSIKKTDTTADTGSASSSADTSWSSVEENGTLKIGLCPEYPPFESVNDNGEIEGFDASLAEAIGKELGVKVELINTPWEGLIAGLNNGDFDMIMSAMSPEEATSATDAVSLSDEYYQLCDVIVVGKDNTDISDNDSLNGKNVGYQTGSGAEQTVEGLESDEGISFGQKSPYNRNADAFADLENKRIDAIIVSYPYAVTQAKEDKNFKVVQADLRSCGLVAVMKKGADELTKKYNEALAAVKESGEYDTIEQQWLSLEQ